jgi:hypothetical protein
MAVPGQVFFRSDRIARSVSVVIDPRDFVTGGRVPVPLEVRLKDVAAEPIAARSGVYCFIDLRLAPADYTVQVRPLVSASAPYFDAEKQFAFGAVSIPAEPLKRNPVSIDLLPRPAYPFDGQATLARGRLLRASNKSPMAGALIFLILEGSDIGRRGQTDERGEFAVFFPFTTPADDPTAGPKEYKFTLRFEIEGLVHETAEAKVKEGTTESMKEIQFPGA